MASCAKWGSPMAAVRPHPAARSARGASCTGEFRRCAGQLRRCASERRWQRFRPAMLPRGATRDQPAGRLPGRRTCVCDHPDCRRLLEVFNRANCLSKADASPAGVAAVASPAGEVRCWGGAPWARRPPELARCPRQWCWGAGGAEPLWCWLARGAGVVDREVRPRSEVRRAPAGRGAPGAPDWGEAPVPSRLPPR